MSSSKSGWRMVFTTLGSLLCFKSFSKLTAQRRKISLVQIERELLRIQKEVCFIRPPSQQSSDLASLIDTLKGSGDFKLELNNKSNSELVQILEKARQQRHFMFWGDASIVMNAGHYLHIVRVLYYRQDISRVRN